MVRRNRDGQNDPHPTKVALINTAVALLGQTAVEDLTINDVLTASGISYGSLYHHFEDFPDLVEHALLQLFGQYVDASIEAMQVAYGSAVTKEEFSRNIAAIARVTHAPERADRRMRRIVIFANTESSQRLRAGLACKQQRLTSTFASFIGEAQNRGWIESTIDPAALAGFVQAYTLGRVVDDINPAVASADAYYALIDRVVARAFLTAPHD